MYILANLNEDETALMTHISRWGSRGYPLVKVAAHHWAWYFLSLGSKVVFPSKRQAVASFETFMADLRDKHAGRPIGDRSEDLI